jgi:predicted methyltransferase
MPSPLLTQPLHAALLDARRRPGQALRASLDLGRTECEVHAGESCWSYGGRGYPYLERCRERTVYHWTGAGFEPVARYGSALVKLVPTDWGPPTFEIDGIKMLPTARVSPWEDAQRKVALVQPQGRRVLDTCGGLGYFAACCLEAGATRVLSFEKNPDVLWLRTINPWSPQPGVVLQLVEGDVVAQIRTLQSASFDAVLHDPPRFGTAGELYSADFYAELARVLVPRGRLFHYTGTPNRLTTGRDVPQEVTRRLRATGFDAEPALDGVLATRRGDRANPRRVGVA